MAVLTCNQYSLVLKGFTTYTAILPTEPMPSPESPSTAYNVGLFRTLYLLHGYSGNHMDWLTNTRISEWAVRRNIAVIMPGCGNTFYLDIADTEQKYGEFIGRELVEATRAAFPLSQNREDTWIGGLSMGGFGALRNGLKYSDTFGTIIALSSALITDEISTLKPGERNPVAGYDYYRHIFGDLQNLLSSDNDPKYLAKTLMERGEPLPKLFMACGTEDFLNLPNQDMHVYLNSIGYPHEYRAAPGVHDWDFWNRFVVEGLDWAILGQ